MKENVDKRDHEQQSRGLEIVFVRFVVEHGDRKWLI